MGAIFIDARGKSNVFPYAEPPLHRPAMGLTFIFQLWMHLSGPQLNELTEVIEDTIEYFCDKEQVSGELAWTVISCLATAKLSELKGQLAVK